MFGNQHDKAVILCKLIQDIVNDKENLVFEIANLFMFL